MKNKKSFRRVSTLRTYSSQSSLAERQAIIDEDNDIEQNPIAFNTENNNQPKTIVVVSEEDNQNKESKQEQFIETNQVKILINIM